MPELKKAKREFVQQSFDHWRTTIKTKLLSLRRPKAAVDPILWLPMTREEPACDATLINPSSLNTLNPDRRHCLFSAQQTSNSTFEITTDSYPLAQQMSCFMHHLVATGSTYL
ncbi:hypothetical protein CU098_006759 [Rhizopus stolonifer]|uniref:Uncharacterized protein n=1 Tax=Rhizopus stolonifer TaxID=4846 RepID=A0A367JVE6_RHIST|nr:hypothetical protein CU098_006759 [Rhizopus stolonifer]